MSRRVIAKPNQSYLDANRGRVIAVEEDVLHIRAQIRQQWPDLDVVYDQEEDKWIVIQSWTDEQGNNRETLVLLADELDQRVIKRLHEGDPTGRNYVDPIEAIDKHNAQIERDNERKFEDQIGDFGERFRHALKKDGVFNHDNIEGGNKKFRARLSNRAINNLAKV